ncbi:thiamine pyrophosphate-binding protein [Jannaschia sp. CCS1]|uniref:thiamine pyrophosphate-binding protein n=1 Tax=Jannaschia sp. (strain CCS1) TaxID=290400 RepID=UPI000053D64C|nr:thiamine pyrophosphate-binding protein [Jannaschia sp. CCS1]ABD56121.1 thiamine pyrophosphate enzyme-like TPP-binding protein [Jannaschia sp. CCS1]
MMGEMRAADAVAERLYEAGCRHAFGMPGGEVLTIVDALEKAGIAFHLVKHENAGGFIGEGVHHVDGAPVVLVATVGPGLMNAVNVVANAEQDRVPMVVLTGCLDADEALTYTHQVLDHRAVLDPITKATFTLSAAEADTIADKAVAIAMERRAGPVLIDVPIAVADAPCTPKGRRRVEEACIAPYGVGLHAARQWLAEARRPLIIAGLDVLRDSADDTLEAFAERFGAPVITTYKAKGVLPEDHALALGGAGLSPLADTHLLPLVAQADLILLVGYDPIEMRPGWREVWDPNKQRVIDIQAVSNRHYMHQAGLSFTCHVGGALTALFDVEPQETWPEREVAATKTALAASFPEDDDWGPAGVIAEARAALPASTRASVDSGAHRILLSQMWTCPMPRALIQSTALCTMGCAVPMAMGLALADPDSPAVGFVGDGGFLMVAGELTTAAEMDLRPIIIVFVDASLALIEKKQRERQLKNAAVDYPARHDIAGIGRAMGGAGVTVHNRAELRAAIETALEADTFTVIAAEIERGGYDGRI